MHASSLATAPRTTEAPSLSTTTAINASVALTPMERLRLRTQAKLERLQAADRDRERIAQEQREAEAKVGFQNK